jgi:N-acetylmuramic acid 6-phosphate etherase
MKMITEDINPRSTGIDQRPTEDILKIINDEDKLVAPAVEKAIPDITRAVALIVERLEHGGRLIYVGAGTSGRLGILDASECIPTFNTTPGQVQGIIAGGHAAITQAIEGAEDNTTAAVRDLQNVSLAENDAVVGIAASGRTPYVHAALDYAGSIGAATVSISCNAPPETSPKVDVVITAIVGPEIISGSTRMKSGTAQKMILNMISTTAMIQLGKVYDNLMVDMQPKNQKLRERAVRLVTTVAQIDTTTAQELLQQANYEVKTAIVMAKQDVTADKARKQLEAVKGRLRLALQSGEDV